jgi:hypothetical protein
MSILCRELCRERCRTPYARTSCNSTKLATKRVKKLILATFGTGHICSGLIPNLKVAVLGTVLHKGLPDAETLSQLDALAAAVAKAHADDPDVLTV